MRSVRFCPDAAYREGKPLKSARPAEGPICGVQWLYPAPGKGKADSVRKHYATRFELAGVSIVWIGAHLKAIPTQPKSCAQREGQ
eukprot:gene23195-28071_t